jgi:hypothetical protein
MAVHLATLREEVKDGEIVAKMLRSLPPHFKQIMIVIMTLLDVSTMSIADLTGRLKEVEEAFKEALTSLQQDGKLYLIEEEWDARRKKRGVENHSGSGARGGGAGKGHGHGCGRLLHQVGRRASPPAMSVTRSLRRSRCMSCKMKRNTMMEEMDAIEESGTWSLVDLSPDHKPIGVKWVFKVKQDEYGAVSKHKARLVVKGYVQRHGINYDEVFTPVAQLDSMRFLIALTEHGG